MKIVSPKTFIVSLLLGILVLYKVLSIDGFTDILWISLMGYWTIRGMRVAFSQESAVLIFAAGYAVWIALYISKHKKKAVETGSWETGKLNADNERA